MAKDDREIKSNVRIGRVSYGPGREDELAAELPQERLDELVKAGALSGTWKAGKKADDKAAKK